MIMAGSVTQTRMKPSRSGDLSEYTYEDSSVPATEKWLAEPSEKSESVQEAFWSNAVENLLKARRASGINHPTTNFVPPRLANGNNSCWMNAVLQVRGSMNDA
jgi:hypothetical protein